MANDGAISSIAQNSGESLAASLSSAAQNIAATEITILIKSNRNYVQGFNAMGSPYNGNDNANANQEYRYNFTGYVFNTSNSILTIQVKGIGASTFSTFSTPFAGNTPQSVAQTLNTLSIGIFNTYTDLGQTYVSTHNDFNVYGDLTISSDIVSVEQIITTQGGDPLTAQNGDIITTEVSNTTIFPVEYIPQGDPALTITVQDTGAGGGGGTSYAQVRNAFSQNNYEVQGMYMYSPNIQQLTNVIQYNSLDVDGSKQILNIANTIDPNQVVNSSIVDLSQFNGNVVFNGNSFISSNILPFNELQMKFLAKNINTNSDLPINNFLDIERITNTKFFEPDRGELSIFEKNEAEILNAIPKEEFNTRLGKFKNKISKDVNEQNTQLKEGQKVEGEDKNNLLKNKYTPFILLGVIAIASIFIYSRKKKI